jgi:hypothetical protein
MKMRGLLILFIGLSLAIQNTCPYGLAAKTGFASPRSHRCHCAKKAAEQSKKEDNTSSHFSPKAGPVFLFIGQERVLPSPLQVVQKDCKDRLSDLYKNISLNPPEKPPRIS